MNKVVEQKERDERLARALGWKWQGWGPCSPSGPMYSCWYRGNVEDDTFEKRDDAPDFHADTPEGHWWQHQLLLWLSRQDKRLLRHFWDHLDGQLGMTIVNSLMYDDNYFTEEDLLCLMTATPKQVAEAADQAIQEALKSITRH